MPIVSSRNPEQVSRWPLMMLPFARTQWAPWVELWPLEDLMYVAGQAGLHQLATLFATNIRPELPASLREHEEIARLMAAWRRDTIKALIRDRELGDVLKGLNQAGIRPVVFKGAALAHTVYPSSACRTMSDIDVWVPGDEIDAAQRALEQQGYEQSFKATRPQSLREQNDGEIQLRGTLNGQSCVEVHRGVFPGEWLRYTTQVDRAAIWERTTLGHVLGQEVRFLAPEDALIQLIVHLAVNHQMSLHPLRSLVDMALLIEQGIVWPLVEERARAWRLAQVTGLTLSLLCDVFALSGPRPTAERLLPAGGRKQLLHRFADAQALIARPTLSSGKKRFFYLLALPDRWRDSARLLGRTLWPEPEWLQARYGAATWPIRLRHTASAFTGEI
jgi:hypothetical protein